MNYLHHYTALIERARNRVLHEYTESHHIIPRCLLGSDDASNLVELTPEEHYVAHQLLVKIYPLNRKLLHAACMMAVSGSKTFRNNKLYGWLRRQLSVSARLRTGNANGSKGKPWYHSPLTLESGKFLPGFEPLGWVPGRVPRLIRYCLECSKDTNKNSKYYCDEHRPRKKKTVFKSEKTKNVFSNNEKLTALIKYEYNIRQALFSLGLNDSGENYRMMKKIINASVSPLATNQEKGNWTHAGSTPV